MKENMILTAVEETGLSEENKREIRNSVKSGDYLRARNLLHNGRDTLIAEIHGKEEEVRHIDWLIYNLGRAGS